MAFMGKERKECRVLVRKPKEMRPLVRPRHRWETENRMCLREIGWGCEVDPVGSGWGSVVCSCKYCDELPGSGARDSVNPQVTKCLQYSIFYCWVKILMSLQQAIAFPSLTARVY